MGPSFKQRDGLFATVDCASWDDFRIRAPHILRTIAGSPLIAERFIFRGQSCSEWKLSAGFDRVSSALSRGERDQKYKLYIESFRENYGSYGNIGNGDFSDKFQEFDKLTEPEVEAVAQHFGLSTRLLDWSRSLYVSSFFAVSKTDECKSGLISVWALDCDVLKYFSTSELVFIEDFYRGNIRNLWQMGAFLRNLTSHADLSDLFRSSSTSFKKVLLEGPPALIRFDFPASDEAIILDDLQMMRINSMTIFPGMEGVVGWIKRKNGM